MVIFEKAVAAATAALDYDFCADEDVQEKPYPRVIQGVGFTGSAAELEAAIEIRIGNERLGRFWNTSSGGTAPPQMLEDIKDVFLIVPANTMLQVIVVDAPATNIVTLHLSIKEYSGRSRIGRALNRIARLANDRDWETKKRL